MYRSLVPVILLFAIVGQPLSAENIGDPERGAAIFKQQCGVCHQMGQAARHRIGPILNNIYGSRAGAAEGYKYSKSMTRMGADGLIWTLETLNAYVENPKALVSGTKMNYKGLKDEVARAAVLAYLREYSDRPRDIPEAEPTAKASVPPVDPTVLAIQGDPAYGEYLSSECVTCHQADGSDAGIPSITGWPKEDFVVAMHAYRQKLRPHQVMQMMAGRLADDEIAALAAYFATLE